MDKIAKRAKWVAALAAIAIAGAAHSAPIQWTVASGGNGHWYEYVDDSAGLANWNDVVSSAASRLHGGQAGYLATVTSASENAFIHSLTGGGRAWLGGSDAGDEGNWTWRTGPEQNQGFTYTNWGPTEPNNVGEEDYLVMNFPHVEGLWNDIPLASHGAIGYVVEFPPIPEPQTYAMLLAGLGVLAAMKIRRTRK